MKLVSRELNCSLLQILGAAIAIFGLSCDLEIDSGNTKGVSVKFFEWCQKL